MYEVTVSAPKKQNYLLHHVDKSLCLYLKQINGIATHYESKNRSYYTIACKELFSSQLKRQLLETVSQVLSLGYKNIYVRKLLDIENCNFYQNILINVLCVFDNAIDQKYISHVVDTSNNIFLDGYYNFKMKDIKQRWKQITNMIVDNAYIINDNDLIVEFLLYLLESVDNKLEQLNICFNGQMYYLCDCNNKVIEKSITLSQDTSVEMEAMVNAVCLNPKKIKVYSNQKPTSEFCLLLNKLFDVDYVYTN